MTPKQKMMIDYLDGKITNVEIIEAWDRQREQNKRYREVIDSMRLHAHYPEIIKQIYEALESESE